jgi:hypothetical protein
MPDLTHALQGNDLGFLRMVANAWGLELDQPDAATALPVLVDSLKDPPLLQEVLDVLPQDALEALQVLLENEGRLGWAAFCRRFGEVRPMGPGKRDRERPDLKPASITEVLWYRALIGKAFFNLPPEPQEYAFIPDDLAEFLAHLAPAISAPLGRPASPSETALVLPASDRILDHTCTLLAALRAGLPLEPFEQRWPMPLDALLALLKAAGLVDQNLQIMTEAVRAFLEASRGEALLKLAQSWLESETFNELRLLPGLCFEGQWDNRPHDVRRTLLALLSQLPQDNWWSLNALVNALKEKQPDFQRPGGDYDTWFIRKDGSEKFLRGFESWDEVDGALVRYLITGPLHWLGWYDLASPTSDTPPTAFRPSACAAALWQGHPPAGLADESAQLRAGSDGRIRVPVLAPRSVRYQIGRFCEWESETPDEYRFRLVPASLERARQQGLRASHLLAYLRRYAAQPLPPTLVQALERWEKIGSQAHLEHAVLLRLASPDLLAALRKSRAARYLGEALSQSVVIIKPGGEEAIRQVLAEMGYLAEDLL